MSFFSEFGRVTRSGFNRVIEARERQVRRYVHGELLKLDDKNLAELGYSRKELQRNFTDAAPF